MFVTVDDEDPLVHEPTRKLGVARLYLASDLVVRQPRPFCLQVSDVRSGFPIRGDTGSLACTYHSRWATVTVVVVVVDGHRHLGIVLVVLHAS